VAERVPGRVPDEPCGRAAVPIGPDAVDTDGDRMPDTAVRPDGSDLVLLTDLDGDRLADRELRIGPDGVVREVLHPVAGPGGTLAGLLDGVDSGW
jgi:hypothetical protein